MTIGNNVSFTGSPVYHTQDLSNLAKYATGVAISNKDDISATEVLTYPLMPATIQGSQWLWNNKKDLKGAFNGLKAGSTAMNDIYKTAGVRGVMASSAGNVLAGVVPTTEALGKMTYLTSATSDLYAAARTAAQEAAKSGSTTAINNAHKLLAQANQAAYMEKVAASTGIGSKISNAIGITKANNAINALAVKSPTFAKGLHAFKAQGGGIMLALEGGVELVTNVVPTFSRLGAKAGMKQLGKSTVKTVASVGGWVAGAALGTKIGALIGSVIPGAGTAIGAVVGGAIGTICSLLGGALGSKLAKKGAEKVVGKDELVIAQEKQAEELAKAAQSDANLRNEIINTAAERLDAEGTGTKDAQVAFRSLSQVAGAPTSNPFTSTTPSVNPFLFNNSQYNSQKDILASAYGMQ